MGSLTDPAIFVSIVVPTLNEEAYIEACLTSLLGQWPDGLFEILVMDGGSTDRTQAIVASFCERHQAVVLLSNPGRIQSAAMNLAAEVASQRSTVLVRADAHAAYPAEFVRRCINAIMASDATSVVVPMRTRARSGAFLQTSIAAAQSSRLGNGGAAHRVGTRPGFVEHGHHAVFDRAFFRRIGGYDESFTHNEDAELDIRAIKAGGRIWMCPDAPVTYYPRDRLGRLARQYFRHGAGRARTLRKHSLRPKPRQMIPVAALAGCMTGVAMAPFEPGLALLTLLYPAICLGWGVAGSIRWRDPALLASGLALITMHLSWAAGFLSGGLRPMPGSSPPESYWHSGAAIAAEPR